MLQRSDSEISVVGGARKTLLYKPVDPAGGANASGITTVDNNIIIGHHSGVHSVFGQESNRSYIDNISSAPVSAATAAIVMVDSDGRLGTVTADRPGNLNSRPQVTALPYKDTGQLRILSLPNPLIFRVSSCLLGPSMTLGLLTMAKAQTSQSQAPDGQVQGLFLAGLTSVGAVAKRANDRYPEDLTLNRKVESGGQAGPGPFGRLLWRV